MGDPLVPAREIFRHFPVLAVVAFYVVCLVAVGIFAYGVWLRIKKYRTGRRTPQRVPGWEQVLQTVRIIASHAKLRKRSSFAGWAHALIFWGFAVLFTGSLVIALDHDILAPVSSALHFWKGSFYLWFSLVLDLMGAALLIGLVLMAIRRWYGATPRLDYSRPDLEPARYSRLGYIRDDNIFLWGLFFIGATGFLNEALRIGADRPPFEIWSIVGWGLANGFDAMGLSARRANLAYSYAWWVHVILALAFIAYLPYSKAVHILVDIANLLVSDPLAGKRLPSIPEESATMGYQSLADFTRKELLNLDACTKCGRCHVACPAHAGGWPLSPRDLILGLREQADAALGGGSWLHEMQTASDQAAAPAGLVRPEVLWACTTCLACVEICPVGVEHVPLVVQLRRNLVEQGVVEPNLQRVMENLGKTGNSFGEAGHKRGKWTEALPFKIKDARKEPVEFLWFVGDYASFDPNLQKITRAVARVLHRAGVDFGILYEAEHNSGNDVRRVGEEGLYQMLVEYNLGALAQAQFKEIITTDPHSYNTIRFEYPEFGSTYRIRHYTEVILELIETGRLPVRRRLDAIATYHDPCHLSRYAEVTDAPRTILNAIGIQLAEMPRNRANSFCCGAGGGRIWMTGPGTAERPAVQRIREALEVPGAKYFVVACPKDFTMFRDAATVAGCADRLQVKDMIELVEAAIDLDEAAPAANPIPSSAAVAEAA